MNNRPQKNPPRRDNRTENGHKKAAATDNFGTAAHHNRMYAGNELPDCHVR